MILIFYFFYQKLLTFCSDNFKHFLDIMYCPPDVRDILTADLNISIKNLLFKQVNTNNL